MKKKYFTLFMLIYCFVNQTYGQSLNDKNQIISECLSFKILNELVHEKVPVNFNEYYILNHGIDFTGSNDIEIKEKRVTFIEKSQINTSQPYYLFHTIVIEERKAFVRYYFAFFDKNIEKKIPITINFEKNGDFWQVISYRL